MSKTPEYPGAQGNEIVAESVYFDPDQFCREVEDMQRNAGTNNPRLRSLAYELSGTLWKLFNPEQLPERSGKFIRTLAAQYDRPFLPSLIQYLDEILETAQPLIDGITRGFTGYLCNIEVSDGEVPEVHYTGRNDEFVYDTWAVSACLARADQATTFEDFVAPRLDEVSHNAKVRDSKITTPDTIPPSLLRQEVDAHNRLDRNVIRKEIVDMLAIVQRLVDTQTAANWKLSSAAALGIAEIPENQAIIRYVNENLVRDNLKSFLRIDLFNGALQKELMRAVPPEEKTTKQTSSEEIADRMIARRLWEEMIDLMAGEHTVRARGGEGSGSSPCFRIDGPPERPARPELNELINKGEHQELQRRFECYVDTFLDILGRGIGRGIGRKLNPINEMRPSQIPKGNPQFVAPGLFNRNAPLSEENRMHTIFDEPHTIDQASEISNGDDPLVDTRTFDEKILPYIDEADTIIGTLSLVAQLRALLTQAQGLDSSARVQASTHRAAMQTIEPESTPEDEVDYFEFDESDDSDYAPLVTAGTERMTLKSDSLDDVTPRPGSISAIFTNTANHRMPSLLIPMVRKTQAPPVVKVGDIAV